MDFFFSLRLILICILNLINPISGDIIYSILGIFTCKSILTILVECKMCPEQSMEKARNILIEIMSKNDREWSIIMEKMTKNKSPLEITFSENININNPIYNNMFKLMGLHKGKQIDPNPSILQNNNSSFIPPVYFEEEIQTAIQVSRQDIFNNNRVGESSNKNKQLVRKLFMEIVNIEKEPQPLNLSLFEQLDNVRFELVTYEAQQEKFKIIIKNILENKENFYPQESKTLFIEYIEVIDHLLEELKCREFNIISNISLPEQTKEEIEILSSEGPNDIPLPEQTEQEITCLLEVEDFMHDAINVLNMFKED